MTLYEEESSLPQFMFISANYVSLINAPEPEVVDGLLEDSGPVLLLCAVEHGGHAVVVAGEVVEQDQVAPLQQLLQGRGISFWNRNSSS